MNLNNLSDIKVLMKEDFIKKILLEANDKITIPINNNLIHNKPLTHKEQLLFNIDMYITFLKSKLFINQFELRYIVLLTLNNKYNKILLNNTYYYDDVKKYIDSFIKMFMFQYNRNYNFISKYLQIKKRNFDELISIINTNKKRSYIYFENINTNNMNFYLPLIENMEINS